MPQRAPGRVAHRMLQTARALAAHPGVSPRPDRADCAPAHADRTHAQARDGYRLLPTPQLPGLRRRLLRCPGDLRQEFAPEPAARGPRSIWIPTGAPAPDTR